MAHTVRAGRKVRAATAVAWGVWVSSTDARREIAIVKTGVVDDFWLENNTRLKWIFDVVTGCYYVY